MNEDDGPVLILVSRVAGEAYGFFPTTIRTTFDVPTCTLTNVGVSVGDVWAYRPRFRAIAALTKRGNCSMGIVLRAVTGSVSSTDTVSPVSRPTGTDKSWSDPYMLRDGKPPGDLVRVQPALSKTESSALRKSDDSPSWNTLSNLYSVPLNEASSDTSAEVSARVRGSLSRSNSRVAWFARCTASSDFDSAWSTLDSASPAFVSADPRRLSNVSASCRAVVAIVSALDDAISALEALVLAPAETPSASCAFITAFPAWSVAARASSNAIIARSPSAPTSSPDTWLVFTMQTASKASAAIKRSVDSFASRSFRSLMPRVKSVKSATYSPKHATTTRPVNTYSAISHLESEEDKAATSDAPRAILRHNKHEKVASAMCAFAPQFLFVQKVIVYVRETAMETVPHPRSRAVKAGKRRLGIPPVRCLRQLKNYSAVTSQLEAMLGPAYLAVRPAKPQPRQMLALTKFIQTPSCICPASGII